MSTFLKICSIVGIAVIAAIVFTFILYIINEVFYK